MRVETLIALGGNLGEVIGSFKAARIGLDALPNSRICASSPAYQSTPIGPANQPDYLNAVLCIKTALSPQHLLKHMLAIETRLGRVRNETWGARTLDLDLLSYNGLVQNEPELTLPHPEMQNRIFVLQPLCDIQPDWQHPHLKMTAAQMLGKLVSEGFKPLNEGVAW